MTDLRLKEFKLLHTDGVKTVRIAEEIKENLRHIGVKVTLVPQDSADQEGWQKKLKSGMFHMFLIGYKADSPDDLLSLLSPVFHSQGEKNFFFYQNNQVDKLLEEIVSINDNKVKEAKFEQINQILLDDPPIVTLFYIEAMPGF